jgi:hypothetical protein
MNTTSLPVLQTRSDAPPQCFGKEYDSKAADCAGGPDPAYADPITGSHVRSQCDFFRACGARTQANRAGSLPELRPPQPPQPAPAPVAAQTFGATVASLLNRTAPSVTYAPAAAAAPPRPPAPAPPLYQNRYAPPPPPPPQQAAQPPAPFGLPRTFSSSPTFLPQQQGPVHSPANTYQLNYTMPAYLSVPEAQHPGESLWAVLFREVIRSLLKSAGHSIAHFFDSRPMGPPPTP